MPELPEVHTTATGIDKAVKGLRIVDVWTNYNSPFHAGKDNIKNPTFFKKFKKEITSAKIVSGARRGKNVLIHLDNKKTILVHMKMTGHIMYGAYAMSKNKKDAKDPWKATEAGPLRDDSFNAWIHFVLTLSNKKHLVLSDMRKFAKVTLVTTESLPHSADIRELGPEPLEKNFTETIFKERLLKRPNAPIKQALMDQTLIAGIGNIYSDEILWAAAVHPKSRPSHIPENKYVEMYAQMKKILAQGIDFGGDSMSDYRNIYGERGEFQHRHNAYRLTGKPCSKKNCTGTIKRIVLGGRGTHFCDEHQKMY